MWIFLAEIQYEHWSPCRNINMEYSFPLHMLLQTCHSLLLLRCPHCFQKDHLRQNHSEQVVPVARTNENTPILLILAIWVTQLHRHFLRQKKSDFHTLAIVVGKPHVNVTVESAVRDTYSHLKKYKYNSICGFWFGERPSCSTQH